MIRWRPRGDRRDSEEPRDHPVGNRGLVLVIKLAILLSTADIITEGAVNEEDEEEDVISIGEEVGELHGRGPEKGSGELSDVVEVPADSPPARNQQEGL